MSFRNRSTTTTAKTHFNLFSQNIDIYLIFWNIFKLLEFDKELIGKIPDDEILPRQDLSGIAGSFEELKDPDERKKFLDSLTDDLADENQLL